MIENKRVTCVICPKGCNIDVKLEDGKIVDITGYTCKRGLSYAKSEVTCPTRILTTTVNIKNEEMHRLPVRTAEAIPKELIKKAVYESKDLVVKPPVKMGDVVKENIAGSGVDLIASRSWK